MKRRTFFSECYAGSVRREMIDNGIKVGPLEYDSRNDMWSFWSEVEK